MKKILFVIPHPDDEIVGACILIRKLLREKKKISMVFLTNGVISPNQNWFWKKNKYQDFVKIRKDEMLHSLELLNIKEYYYQNIPTRTLRYKISESHKLICKIIKKNKIDTIFCPAYEGGHQDHDIANFICSRLKGLCNLYEFAEYNFFQRKINSNTFFDSNNNEETILLNHSQQKFKNKCLRIYESEKKNLDYINVDKESFRPMLNHNYSKPPHHGTLFYRRYSFFSWHPKVDSSSPLETTNIILRSNIY
jgi:LmbE family N-acetylglucosaminyl deacetylase